MNPLNLKFKFKKSLWIIVLPKSCLRYSKGVERICCFSSSSSIIDDVMVSWAGKVWAEMRVMLLIIVLCHHVTTSTGALQPDTLWHSAWAGQVLLQWGTLGAGSSRSHPSHPRIFIMIFRKLNITGTISLNFLFNPALETVIWVSTQHHPPCVCDGRILLEGSWC